MTVNTNRIKLATRFGRGGGSEVGVAAGDPARETAGALLSVISCSTRSCEAGDIHAGDAELQGCEKFCQKLGENEMIEDYLGKILGAGWQ